LPAEHNPAPRLGRDIPLRARPITMARAVAEYAGLLVLPVNLHMERDVRSSYQGNLYADSSAAAARELQTLLGIVLLAALIFYMTRIRRRDPLIFALLVCGLITYLPVSGLIRLNASVAEHWIYVPSAFFFLAVVLHGCKLGSRVVSSRLMFGAGSVICASWVLFLGGRTFVRTFDWKDQRTFLERTVAAGGDSARMLINLGALESSENHLERGRKYLAEALKKEPDQPFGLVELAAICIKQNDFTAAHELLGKAAESPVVGAHAQELLAVLENKEKGQANLLRMRLAAHTGFPNWSIEKRYINVLVETGATSAALLELKTCLETEWYRAETWQLLGNLLARTGQNKAAAEAFALANDYDVHLSARHAAL
jgi:tetratricopeptide (TPR) repeat protein